MFSQQDLADYAGRTFECAWTKLRAAPQVTIDFGEGRVVRRTLHGNVLTWICDPEGRALDADTKLNETVRRRAVHEILAATGRVAPAELTKRVYREVLGVDLADPYLGLGKLLFETYPFEK